jgi:hypothetical protein
VGPQKLPTNVNCKKLQPKISSTKKRRKFLCSKFEAMFTGEIKNLNDDMEVQGHMEILVLDKTIVVDQDDL